MEFILRFWKTGMVGMGSQSLAGQWQSVPADPADNDLSL